MGMARYCVPSPSCSFVRFGYWLVIKIVVANGKGVGSVL